jgi:glycerol kinase
MTTGEQPMVSHNRLISTIAWQHAKRHYALEGSVFVAGAVVQWLRDGLGIIRASSEVEALAASVPDSGGVYVVPAFTGLGAPYWDASARGTIVGLTRGTTRAHLVRATLESIALQVGDVVALIRDAGVDLRALRVDGGASANNFLMQAQADVLGLPVERSAVQETTALGAAYLAGLGCGLWRPEDLERLAPVERTFHPRMPEAERQALQRGWVRAVDRARGWAEADMDAETP